MSRTISFAPVLKSVHVNAPPALSWIAPTLLSSTDPRVLQVAATLQQETVRKNDLLFQKKELDTRQGDRRSRQDEIKRLESVFQAQKTKTEELQLAIKEQEQKFRKWRTREDSNL